MSEVGDGFKRDAAAAVTAEMLGSAGRLKVGELVGELDDTDDDAIKTPRLKSRCQILQ
jgi:hypothetical protein